MTSRPRPSSAPGSSRNRAGRRPRTGSTAVRRTTKAGGPAEPSSRARLTGRAVIVLVVLAVLAVSYASSARAWLKQRSDISALQAEIASRTAAVSTLQQTTRRWHDPAYIEAQARLRFGWVMPGETGYRVIDANGNVLTDGGAQLPQVATAGTVSTHEWWQREWGSVVAAGTSPPVTGGRDRKPAVQIGADRRPGAAQGQLVARLPYHRTPER